MSEIDSPHAFVDMLAAFEAMTNVFNPWRDFDPVNDIGPQAPEIRRSHLRRYLEDRIGRARWILVAEAPGYQGAKFSGIAMTSERMLVGKHKQVRSHWVLSEPGERTSAITVSSNTQTEPTATIVWGEINALGLDPYEVVLWNAFPFHPHPSSSLKGNRTPGSQEIGATRRFVPALLKLFPGAGLVAIGNIAHGLLSSQGLACKKVRHPANWGAADFREQLRLLMEPGDAATKAS